MLDENQYSFSMHFVHMNVPNSYEKLVFMLFLSLKWGPRIGELSWPKDDKPLILDESSMEKDKRLGLDKWWSKNLIWVV